MHKKKKIKPKKQTKKDSFELIEFGEYDSKLDIDCADCSAQYGTKSGVPMKNGRNVLRH